MDALNAKVDEYLGENRDIEGVSLTDDNVSYDGNNYLQLIIPFF